MTTCDCANKENTDCPDGQKFDSDAGKCKPVEKSKEEFGDPKTQSTQGEFASGDPGETPSDNSGEPCGEGSKWDSTLQKCVPTDQKTQAKDKLRELTKPLL